MTNHLRVRILVTLALAVLGLGLTVAPPASAHDRLIESDPADGATVSTLEEIALTYSDEIIPTGARVQVTGPDGSAATSAEPEVDGTVVTQQVDAADPGAYEVIWRVTSSDGHPISGKFSFTLKGATGDSEPSSPAGEATSSDGPTGDQWNNGSGSSAADGVSESTSEPTLAPTEQVGTDETSNRPWVIIALAVLAGGGILAGGLFARSRLRDDE